MSGGLINDALVTSYEVETALSKKGTVLTFGSAAGKVDVAAAVDEVVFGFSFGNTKNRITGIAEAGVKVGVIAPVEGLEIEVPLASDNLEITYGTTIVIDDGGNGLCNAYNASTQTGTRVGYALEAKDANDGTYVKIRVSKANVPASS